MSVSLMTKDGLLEIPVRGGDDRNEIQRLEALIVENRAQIEGIKNLKADVGNYGLVKLSDSSAVTDSAGLALPASQNNANVEGTLASRISALESGSAVQAGSVSISSDFFGNIDVSFKKINKIIFLSFGTPGRQEPVAENRILFFTLPGYLRSADYFMTTISASTAGNYFANRSANATMFPDGRLYVDNFQYGDIKQFIVRLVYVGV